MRVMKINNIIRLVSFCFSAVAVLSCEVAENLDEHTAETLVHKIFHATIEDGGMTKTTLDENAVDGVRGLMWDPCDEIGIGIHGSTFRKFTNICTETTFNGVFEGDISESNTYYAIYPWRDNTTMTTEIFVNIPSRQTYRANSFDINMAPMVGRGNNEEPIHFQNLCGILTLNLKGTDKISSITLSAKDARGNKAFLSGNFSVDMGYENFPYPMPTEEALTDIILDCNDGVQLDSETETSFNVIIPPGKYYGLELLIVTSDGKFMKKSTSNTLEIKRSVITKSRSFEFEDNLSGAVVNLNTYGHSNCYVVSSAGVYSFDATVIGNGEFGMVTSADFHTDSPDIAPVSVDLLWEDRAGLIGGYAYDAVAGKVKFISTSNEGNALFAVKDAEGNILWSWHIWMTDQPADQTYVNSAGTFVVQDRNLGATRADRGTGDEWKNAKGILYQWGRKDPFIFDDNGNGKPVATSYTGVITIHESISDPLRFPGKYYGVWESSGNISLWLPHQKTIYDPCPVGYKVARKEIWSDFSKTGADEQNNLDAFNVSGSHDNGWDFYYDGVNTTYIPATDIIHYNYSYEHRNHIGDLWSSDAIQSGYACRWNYEYYSSSNRIQLWYREYTGYGLALRCMKDEDHVDISYPQVKVTGVEDVTASSAKVVAEVTSEGISEVTERGIIWGQTEDLSDGIKVACGSAGGSSFMVDLTGLTKATKYYVKSYAVNSRGESQSSVRNFRTRYSDTETDLSAEETANCYIVSYPGTHSFDCTVKGNSEETVGLPMSAEVLWETDNTSVAINIGDIISNVHLIDQSRVQFEASGKSGNALIAVKDSDGVILWSWHIWVADYNPDATAQTYKSGVVMMDRNLGALNNEKGDVLSWGLFYQQGRKDPFVGCGNIGSRSFAATAPSGVISYSYSGDDEYIIHNPCTTTQSYRFGWADEKSKSDPCPPGWKVPSNAAYSGLTGGNTSFSYSKVFEQDLYFPLTGDTQEGAQSLRSPGTTSYMWTTHSGYAYCIHNEYETSRSMYDENPVRCMKDE